MKTELLLPPVKHTRHNDHHLGPLSVVPPLSSGRGTWSRLRLLWQKVLTRRPVIVVVYMRGSGHTDPMSSYKGADILGVISRTCPSYPSLHDRSVDLPDRLNPRPFHCTTSEPHPNQTDERLPGCLLPDLTLSFLYHLSVKLKIHTYTARETSEPPYWHSSSVLRSPDLSPNLGNFKLTNSTETWTSDHSEPF